MTTGRLTDRGRVALAIMARVHSRHGWEMYGVRMAWLLNLAADQTGRPELATGHRGGTNVLEALARAAVVERRGRGGYVLGLRARSFCIRCGELTSVPNTCWAQTRHATVTDREAVIAVAGPGEPQEKGEDHGIE